MILYVVSTSENVIHRDLAARNVLLNEKMVCKVNKYSEYKALLKSLIREMT